ncbi:MAG: radical SAM protein [Firmicutes bacterium]|nr:radical SAM protein [Bacillota bacterium]
MHARVAPAPPQGGESSVDRQSGGTVPRLRLVFWELTNGCNLRCQHCRATAQPGRSPDELDTGAALQIVEQLAEMGPLVLILTGGEPLYRPDVFTIARRAADKGLHVALATNGTLVDGATADAIVAAGVERVSISLDGSNARTHDSFRGIEGAFDRALQGFHNLKERGVSLQFNTTVARHNVDELPDIIALARRVGADALHLFMLVPVGCGAQIAETQMLPAQRYEEVLGWLARESQAGDLEVRATCAPHYYRILRQQRRQPGTAAGRAPSVPGHPAAGVGESHGAAAPSAGTELMRSHTRGCLAGVGVMFISHTGTVQPCGYLPVEAGNLRQQTVRQVWEASPVFAALRDESRLTGKCGRCPYKHACGGCRARAFYASGDYLAEEPYCIYEPAGRHARAVQAG